MAYFLGADARGNKTELLPGNKARELAKVHIETIKRMKFGEEVAEPNLEDAPTSARLPSASECDSFFGAALATQER